MSVTVLYFASLRDAAGVTSETLPLNDGGIAAGQLWFAIHHIATHQPVTTGCATLSES